MQDQYRKNKKREKGKTCRWLLTWEIVSPLTSISCRTSLGVASTWKERYQHFKPWSETIQGEGEEEKEKKKTKEKRKKETYYLVLQVFQWHEQNSDEDQESISNEEP